MKICIDARLYGLENAGIGRYVMNLIEQIGKKDDKNQYFILLKKKYFKKLKFENKKFKKVLVNYPHYSLKEQVFLPLQLIKLKPDLVHFPHFNVPVFWRGKYVVTIHDLIKHYFRGRETTTRGSIFYWFKYLNYRILLWLAVKRAEKVITPSNYWKEKLIKRYHLPEEKVEVTYEGVDEKYQVSDKMSNVKAPFGGFLRNGQMSNLKILKKYKIKKPFIVYTGSLYPHKNVEFLIRTLKEFNKSKRLYLIIVCARNVFQKRLVRKVAKLKMKNYVKFIGFVPDEDLIRIYQQAEAFVFPSLMEGFGLPALEAMAVGLPVLASDIPVFREIYKDAVFYFNPFSVQDLKDKIKKILENKKEKEKLRKKGLALVKNYSWEKMAKQTIEIYRHIDI